MKKLLTFKRRGEPETTGEPLHYTASGLDDVYLFDGFKVETIDGEEYVTIEDLDGLWKAIGLHLVTTRKALAPKEIKFLRHHMNLTQAELGSRMRVTDQTVARWEKGLTELSGPADTMLRVLFLDSEIAQPEGAEQHIGELIKEIVEQDEPEARPAVFEHGKKWKQSKRELKDAVALLEGGNRRTEESIAARQANVETLVSTLDTRTEDFGQRLARFSTALDESLQTATARAGDFAGMIAKTSNESLQTIEQQYELVRKTSAEERTRTSDALTAAYDEAFSQVQSMFTESAARFSEVMQGMKQMAAEMQQELEATREQLRRGVLEQQETAESTAQMRRVIVDQIEALAKLNRIVARHERALDAVEPVRRDVEALYAAGGGRTQARPVRSDVTAPQPAPARGWLSELVTRASRESGPQGAPVTPATARDSIESLDALLNDIARMIDNDAAADLWERYKRGDRGAFTKRLYTAQGQRAFEEIRGKYRSDADFRQTAEHYIHEFERLLDDVSRGDRGPVVARNYLTSDTGKVYTMLAHAAGRFE